MAVENLKDLRILVVEDCLEVGVALRRLLISHGADVVGPAASTADAKVLVVEHGADVAIVDIRLRGGEMAYDLIDWLSARGIRIVVASGCDDISLEEGKVAAILQKPVDEEPLIASLRPMTATI